MDFLPAQLNGFKSGLEKGLLKHINVRSRFKKDVVLLQFGGKLTSNSLYVFFAFHFLL